MRLAIALLLVGLATVTAAPQLTLNATSIQDGEYVQVTVSGVTNATIQDAVGLFLGNSPNPNLQAPVKYQWAANYPGYLTSGTSKLTFQVLNMRDNVTFLLFSNVSATNPFSNVTEVAASPALSMANLNEPLHGHLAVTQNPGEIVVQWQTASAGTPTVQYGTISGQYSKNVTGTNVTFTASEMCGAPANSTGFVNPGAINRVLLTNLTANTRYYYVYGDPKFGFSSEASFLTSPPVGPDSTLEFLIVADLGHAQIDGSFEYDYDESADILNYQATGHNVDAVDPTTIADYYVDLLIDNVIQQGASRYTVAGLTENVANRTLMFLNGDISYARGEIAQWDTFWSQMTNLTEQIPLMVQLGNHERDFPGSGDRFDNTAIDSGGECGVVTNAFFDMPYQGNYTSPIGKNKTVEWYSFDQGPVHFLELSSEVDFAPGSPQQNFIISDLAAVNRTLTPWIVVNFHRPNYAAQTGTQGSITSGYGVAYDWRAATEELFFLNNVDITFSGHVHGYQRTCPVYFLECMGYNSTDGTANAPVNVMLGNAGYALTFQAITTYPPYWEIMALEHGYATCSANATTFTCTEYSSISGKELDSFTLVKPAGWNATVANAARTAANELFVSNYTDTNVLDAVGLTSDTYTVYLGAAEEAFKSNASIIAALTSINNSTRALENAVNGADTVVDIWEGLEPTVSIIQELTASNSSVTKMYGNWLLELTESLRVAADAYPEMNGVMYRSDRLTSPFNALATAQANLASAKK